MKILAVDDEPLFLELLAHTLSQLDFRDVHFATSGQDALGLITHDARSFDCFLLDIKMDPMNGIDLCRQIRILPEHRHTPVVMVTAMSEKRYVDNAFMAGADDYVTKPIDRIEIKARLSMVQTILNERIHTGLLARQIAMVERTMGAKCQFSEPIILNDARDLVPYASLENYLLRLGNMRLLSSAAVAFHVENGTDIFERASGLEFADMLTDAAAVVGDALKSYNHMLAYAGSGDFVAVIARAASFDQAQVQLGIQEGLAAFSGIYLEEGIAAPIIRVGAAKTNGLLSFGNPTRMLSGAIMSARAGTQAGAPRARGHIRVMA